MMMFRLLLLTFVLVLPSLSWAKTLPYKFGGFIDSYYAYDSNRPPKDKRHFSSQPLRHNEPSINLAYLDISMKKEKTRGRLALQQGDSVDWNYQAEKNEDIKLLQEAFIGFRLADKTWMDLGVFLGNIGAESWISKDNWTYSRALNLDYVPYYSAGVRIDHSLDERQSIQLHILNGWQNISRTNEAKALGMQYKNIISPKINFTYNNFLGDEKQVPSLRSGKRRPRFRTYHNFIFQYLRSTQWQYLAAVDVGHQSQQDNEGTDLWYASSMTVRRILNEKQSIAMRGEYYHDRHQTNVLTSTPHGFQVVSASVNFDHKLSPNALWRSEVRGYNSKDKIYPKNKDDESYLDSFFVTSIALWF